MLKRQTAWPAAGLTIALWASAFVAIRAALEAFSAVELTVLRLVLASVALIVMAPVVGVRRPAAGDLTALVACGVTGMAAYQLLLNTGEQTVSAGTASMLINTGPVFVALLARAFLDERLTARTWQGLTMAFAGAAVIAVGQRSGISLSGGAVLVLAAAASQATFFVLQKPLLSRYSAFEVTAFSTWVATLTLAPLAMGVPSATTGAGAEALVAVLVLGVGASAIGFFSWAHAMSQLPVSIASATLYAVPVVTVLVAFLWLGEVPPRTSLIGGAVALLGVARATIGRTTRRTEARGPADRDRVRGS